MVKCLLLTVIFIFSFFRTTPALTYEVVKVDRCRALAYSSEHRQTDHDPFSTASGTNPKWGTVAANHLPLWSRILINGFGDKVFVVEDRMNKRYIKTIDIWFPTKKQAKQFGCRQITYSVIKNVKPLPE